MYGDAMFLMQSIFCFNIFEQIISVIVVPPTGLELKIAKASAYGQITIDPLGLDESSVLLDTTPLNVLVRLVVKAQWQDDTGRLLI